MSRSKTVTVAFGNFACRLEGFNDPFPILQEVVEYFEAKMDQGGPLGLDGGDGEFDALAERVMDVSGSDSIGAEPIAGGVALRNYEAEDAEDEGGDGPVATGDADTGPIALRLDDAGDDGRADEPGYDEFSDALDLDVETAVAADADRDALPEDTDDLTTYALEDENEDDDLDDGVFGQNAFDGAYDDIQGTAAFEADPDDATDDAAALDMAPEDDDADLGMTAEGDDDPRPQAADQHSRSQTEDDGQGDTLALTRVHDADVQERPTSPADLRDGEVGGAVAHEMRDGDGDVRAETPDAQPPTTVAGQREPVAEHNEEIETDVAEPVHAVADAQSDHAEYDDTEHDDAPIDDAPMHFADSGDEGGNADDETDAAAPAVAVASLAADGADDSAKGDVDAPAAGTLILGSGQAVGASPPSPLILRLGDSAPRMEAGDDGVDADNDVDFHSTFASAMVRPSAAPQTPEASQDPPADAARTHFTLDAIRRSVATAFDGDASAPKAREADTAPPSTPAPSDAGAQTPSPLRLGGAGLKFPGFGRLRAGAQTEAPEAAPLRLTPDAGSRPPQQPTQDASTRDDSARGRLRIIRGTDDTDGDMPEATPEKAPVPPQATAPTPDAAGKPAPQAQPEPAAQSGKPGNEIAAKLQASFTTSHDSSANPVVFLGTQDAEDDTEDMTPIGFARRSGASSLSDLMEVSAAYLTLVEEQAAFSRGDIMAMVDEIGADQKFTAEAKIKSFGKLLRNGALIRLGDGRFMLSDTAVATHTERQHA